MCYPITPFPGSHTRRQPHPRLDTLLIATDLHHRVFTLRIAIGYLDDLFR
jgi:hypothetical protein